MHDGVIIQGPIDAGKAAVIDRGNTSSGSHAFSLSGVSNLTISHLHITGGEFGVLR
ncbi:MAG: hypothetical protein R3C99_00740 [Pirellulaceae bacterium]